MDTTAKTAKPPFGFRDKLGYLFGDFGNDFTFILSSGFLLKFYTDVMGVAPWVVGLVMTLARFVDAFTDVTMGRICDRSTVTKHGKFKPWIRRMCAPVAIASFLIYQSSFAGAAMWFKILWLTVTYILWGSIFYTSINIPYGSMASSISHDPDHRQSLSTYRSIGSSLAGLVIGAGVPLLAYDNIEGHSILVGEKFTAIAGVFSILAVLCYMLCFSLTTERVITEHHDNHSSVGTMLKNVFHNRALISIVVASVVMLLSQLTLQSMANYIYPNYYGNTAAQSSSAIIMVLSMFVAAGVAKPLARKFGKAELSVAANLFAFAICLILFFFRPENVWVYVILNSISFLGLGIFTMVSWAIITDVIDDSEVIHGKREDGTIYAIYSFARKLGQALAAGLSGALLSLIGYSDETAFLPSVLSGIYTIATLIPALGFLLLALILWFWYPLHKHRVENNVAELLKKRENGN